ncbi:unnamed protein product [Paramecium octaurelia]|uniref:Uncharacterized protein n=1 Tax=Paramecium octaurelia TaxID=43137 RepID=A0A8S1TV47_PAROT|nr:unnamed protein product [Paramecium octaurelia]
MQIDQAFLENLNKGFKLILTRMSISEIKQSLMLPSRISVQINKQILCERVGIKIGIEKCLEILQPRSSQEVST